MNIFKIKDKNNSNSGKKVFERLKSLRVCHVQMAYYGNPQQRAFREYTQQLARKGHRVTVIAAGQPEEPEHEWDDAGVEIFRVPVPSIRKVSVQPLFFAIRATGILSKIRDRLDLVHCYMSWEMAIIGLYCRTVGLPAIYDIRSGPITYGLVYRVGIEIQKTIARIFDTCVVISEPLGEKLFGSGGYPYEVVPIGTEMGKFQKASSEEKAEARKELGLDDSVPVAVYCGLMRNSKGAKEVTDIAIETCRLDDEIHFLIVGGGDDLKEHKARVQNSDVASRIHFTGQVPPDEVPFYLGAADVGLGYLPSNELYDPQPPLKTAEILACGLPLVATDIPGQRIYVTHNENGLLIEDDASRLAEAVVDLLGNERKKNEFKKRARKSIRKFDWEVIVDRHLIPVYKNTLGKCV
ncbi:glycosyltransferase family 4 protein [Salinibacter ruber]|uniref:glycosyltransferase family 4 protein n=1 Tax=Salinibacter ruber TaxID=146919 RepID=UPI002166E3CB|nr:glycosyltransferase family 4 protein [Salinibacter ruber]MCS3648567.1 glycosyltransferase involved in cell wall biosynthesis [Salinibacter ruber]